MTPIAIVGLVMSGVEALLKIVSDIRAAASRNGEWSAADEQEFTQRRDSLFTEPHWRIE